jgi:hypothetical protein
MELVKRGLRMEDKKSGGSLLGTILIIAAIWFAYDNLLAKHWTVNWAIKGQSAWFKDDQSPKFKNKQQCISYAADLNSMAEALEYNCGYKCKYSSNMLDYCKDY